MWVLGTQLSPLREQWVLLTVELSLHPAHSCPWILQVWSYAFPALQSFPWDHGRDHRDWCLYCDTQIDLVIAVECFFSSIVSFVFLNVLLSNIHLNPYIQILSLCMHGVCGIGHSFLVGVCTFSLKVNSRSIIAPGFISGNSRKAVHIDKGWPWWREIMSWQKNSESMFEKLVCSFPKRCRVWTLVLNSY